MAEIQKFTYEKATKETLRALALGLDVEKKAAKPMADSLRSILGFYFSTEITPKIVRKIDNGLSRGGVIFQRLKAV